MGPTTLKTVRTSLVIFKCFYSYSDQFYVPFQTNCTDLGAVCMALNRDMTLNRCVCPNGVILDHVHPKCSECKHLKYYILIAKYEVLKFNEFFFELYMQNRIQIEIRYNIFHIILHQMGRKISQIF